MHTPFADNQERFVFQGIRQTDRTKLQAAQPTGHLHILQGIKHVAKLVHGIFVIRIGVDTLETVQFFIIVIFDFLADGSQQTVAFAGFMSAKRAER